ncbi:unnamed protein product [Dovyalis caffra]|uniref:Uncharacterized protein n=1 Tax=Dovyalis caffra TaxID=77055 RepID=A0AAV1RTZ9_9ROSI|nr:unnamed protein product [Dovyalis caffra]
MEKVSRKMSFLATLVMVASCVPFSKTTGTNVEAIAAVKPENFKELIKQKGPCKNDHECLQYCPPPQCTDRECEINVGRCVCYCHR